MSNSFAFLFPGQGSQHIGMMADFIKPFPDIRYLYEQASEALGYDLWSLSESGPEEKLNQTEFTQPALLVAGVAMWQIWQRAGGSLPNYFAGHSLGEYTALVCADVLDTVSAVTIVAARGRFMQEAVPGEQGAMAAIIGLEDTRVQELCKEVSGNTGLVAPANYNSIGQIVIAGEITAVMQAIVRAKEEGAKLAKRLPVSVPSHCSLMQPAAERLKDLLLNTTFRKPSIPVINNVDVACYQEPEDIIDALVRQLSQPVRWVEIITALKQKGVAHLVESGPGKVLTGLNKRITPELAAISLSSYENLIQTISLVDEQSKDSLCLKEK